MEKRIPLINTDFSLAIQEVKQKYNLLKTFKVANSIKTTNEKQTERELTEVLLTIYEQCQQIRKSIKKYEAIDREDLEKLNFSEVERDLLVKEAQLRLEIMSPYLDLLIMLWEPKVHKFLQTDFVQRAIKRLSIDKDGMAQELRYSIIKAANLFNPDRTYKTEKGEEKKVLFHTYLHWAMQNTVYTLISKDKKRKQGADGEYVNEINLDELVPLHDFAQREIKGIEPEDMRSVDLFEQIEMESVIENKKLDDKELKFLELRQEGMTMEEISNDLGDSAYKIRQTLREKFSDLVEEY